MNEKKDANKIAEEKEEFEGKKVLKKDGDIRDVIGSVVRTVVMILIIVGGFASGCVRCTNCGDDDNRFFVYASGTSDSGVEYKSCVGPAGLLGFGIGSKCWPTECTYVKRGTTGGKELTGCVTYYNEMGCIAKSDVKSVGKYSDKVTCLGINCFGKKYIETVAETTKAKEQTTCLGVSCGSEETIESKGYNTTMPRQFNKGCWGYN